MRFARIPLLALVVALPHLFPSHALAQDVFELEIFEPDTTPRGRYEVALHVNALSGSTSRADSAVENHRPTHVSIEITRGWTDRLETAAFLQTAPFGETGSARFAGGHLRAQLALGELPRVGVRLAVGTEYTFNRAAFDDELQTLEIRSIAGYEVGRWSLVANPSIEFVTKGPEASLTPIVDLSAGATWRAAARVSVTGEYFSAAGTTRHLVPDEGGHHLAFAGVALDAGARWELAVAAGRCVTRREPWIAKTTIAYSF